MEHILDLYVPEEEAQLAFVVDCPRGGAMQIRSHGGWLYAAFPDPYGMPKPALQVGLLDAAAMIRSGAFLVIGSGVWMRQSEPRYLVDGSQINPVLHGSGPNYYRADDFESAYVAVKRPRDHELHRTIQVLWTA